MATVNSFKVKNVSSIDLPIQISSNRVMDDYTEIGTAYAAIRQLDRNISTIQQNLNKEIEDLHTDYLAWERQHDGAVLKTSLDSGSTTSTRSLVIGAKNQINTDVSNSLVLGIGNIAKASHSLVLGSYASTNSSTLLAIGNGDAGEGSNIFEVNGDHGREYIEGIRFYSDYFAPIGAQTSQLGTENNSFAVGHIDKLISSIVNITEKIDTPHIRTTKIESQTDAKGINLSTKQLWCTNQMKIYAGDFTDHDTSNNFPIIIHNMQIDENDQGGAFMPYFYPSWTRHGCLGIDTNKWDRVVTREISFETIAYDGTVSAGGSTGTRQVPIIKITTKDHGDFYLCLTDAKQSIFQPN